MRKRSSSRLFFVIGLIIGLLLPVSDHFCGKIFAQELPRSRRGKFQKPPNPENAQTLNPTSNENSANPPDKYMLGTVPAIWEIAPSSPELQDALILPLLERDTIAPVVLGKLIRYGDFLMSKFDQNGDGILQKEEWSLMPGSPQSIDIDGDGIISLEELVRFIDVYGKNRTIHRPNPPQRLDQPQLVSSQFQLFRPLSAGTESKKTLESENTTSDNKPVDVSEETILKNETPSDDAAFDEIVSSRQIPADKIYHTAPEEMRGLPAWFILRDRDGDAQVSLLEFAPSLSPAALALFGKLDKNGDGLITPDELRPDTSEKVRQ
ncbi:MAG: hypothetical protein ACRCUY_09340 [Thermoguttaceae bacterium]